MTIWARCSNTAGNIPLYKLVLQFASMDRRLLEEFGYYLKIERAMSPNTVASYCSDVNLFLESADVLPEDVSAEDIVNYFATRTAGDDIIAKRSQARILSSLKSFYNWMLLENMVAENPCDRVDFPKMGRYLPEVLSVEEVGRIIDSVDTGTWQGLRDKAVLELLYGCGLRVSEASGMKLSDLFMEEGFVRVTGKGDKERLVPFGGAAADALSGYLAVRPAPADNASSDILFLNRQGRRLSRISIFKMVKKQVLAAGVNKEISPHTFRHSFATHLIENGADLRVVQEMLGHESILTTEIYTHIDSRTWQSAVIEHHPRK